MAEPDLMSVLFQKVRVGMAVISVPEYRYELVNDLEAALYEEFGIVDYMGRRLSDVWKDPWVHEILGSLDQVLTTGKPVTVVRGSMGANAGNLHPAARSSVQCHPVFGRGDAVEHILLVSKGISQRLKDELLAVASHELRNPLQIILGLSRLLSLRVPPDLRESLDCPIKSIENQTHAAIHLIEDLLNAHRIGEGNLPVDLHRLDFRTPLLHALDARLVDADHPWSISVPDSEVPVLADSLRLSQVVANLLTNASKYTPRGRGIRVALSATDGMAYLNVEDEGVGIPPSDLELVFEGLYRVPGEHRAKVDGLGLGLFIARGLTRAMGGDLWAENLPDGGTGMRLRMPLSQDTGEEE